MYKRIIVKIGSSVLSKDNALDYRIVQELVCQIITLRKKGIEIVLVTSGAVATGRGLVTLHKGLDDTVQKQVYAAVGQVKLMNTYTSAFAEHATTCAQILLTKEDFRDEVHYTNTQNCLEAILEGGIIPIVNENDVTATTELLFTDNDELASLLALQLQVQAVILLTSVDGVIHGTIGDPTSYVIPEIPYEKSAEFETLITKEVSPDGRGGMHTKFAIARELAKEHVTTYIAHGKKPNILENIIDGKAIGTKFLPLK